MRTITIGKNDGGQRLDKFLNKTFKTMPQSMLYKYLRKKCVRVNGVHREGSFMLSCGDELSLYINDEFFEPSKHLPVIDGIKPDFKVVYEDNNILIVNKPVGLICQPDKSELRNTLINHIVAYLINKGEYDPQKENSFVPALCNRIDKNTQGIVLAAKNSESLRILNQKIRDREIHKYYKCLVFGCPKKKKDIWNAYLRKNSSKNTVEIVDEVPQGAFGFKPISTQYEVLDTNGMYSLIRVNLLTGRTHQIRAHFAYMGYPLLGDTKYGKAIQNHGLPFKYQALSSCEISFDFISDAGILTYLNNKSFIIPTFFEDFSLSDIKQK